MEETMRAADAVKKLQDCEGPGDAADAIDAFCEAVLAQSDRRRAMRTMGEWFVANHERLIAMRVLGCGDRMCASVDGDDAFKAMVAYGLLERTSTPAKTIGAFSAYAEELRGTLGAPAGEPIAAEEMDGLLGRLEARYGLEGAVCAAGPIAFCSVPYSWSLADYRVAAGGCGEGAAINRLYLYRNGGDARFAFCTALAGTLVAVCLAVVPDAAEAIAGMLEPFIPGIGGLGADERFDTAADALAMGMVHGMGMGIGSTGALGETLEWYGTGFSKAVEDICAALLKAKDRMPS